MNMKNCRFCGCEGLWKVGIINGKQRYKCKNCGKNQAEADDRVKYTEGEKKQALVLYLEGCGFRRIARIMGKINGKFYRHQTIINWIKTAGIKALATTNKQEKIEVLEMDELYTYVQKKNEEQGYGRLLIGTGNVSLTLK